MEGSRKPLSNPLDYNSIPISDVGWRIYGLLARAWWFYLVDIGSCRVDRFGRVDAPYPLVPKGKSDR